MKKDQREERTEDGWRCDLLPVVIHVKDETESDNVELTEIQESILLGRQTDR